MLLAGEGAAAWAFGRRLPFPYITQETGDLPNNPLEGIAGGYQLRRCMRPRSVSIKPGYHWGLGLEGYTQVTSPLRRYTDLLAHQQIRAFLRQEGRQGCQAGGDSPLTEDEVLLRLAAGDAAAQRVTQAERSSRMYWTAVYLEGLLTGRWSRETGGDPLIWEAVVLEKRGNNTVLIIPDLALETQVLTRKQKEPNEMVKLRLTRVRVPEGEGSFEQLI
jgi:exoribonuclease-2